MSSTKFTVFPKFAWYENYAILKIGQIQNFQSKHPDQLLSQGHLILFIYPSNPLDSPVLLAVDEIQALISPSPSCLQPA